MVYEGVSTRADVIGAYFIDELIRFRLGPGAGFECVFAQQSGDVSEA